MYVCCYMNRILKLISIIVLVHNTSCSIDHQKVNTNKQEVLELRIDSLVSVKNYSRAAKELEIANKIYPNNKKYYYLLGYLQHNHLEKEKEAIFNYKKSINLDTTYLEPIYMLGLLYFNRASSIQTEIESIPSNEVTHQKKLQILKTDFIEKSLVYLNRALEIDPMDLDTYKALREVHYQLGNVTEFNKYNNALNNIQSE